MAIPKQVAGDYIVGSGIQGATRPSLCGEGIDEDGVLEDGCASQPGATCQAPCPLVCDPGGASTATATKEKLGTCQTGLSASSGCRDTVAPRGQVVRRTSNLPRCDDVLITALLRDLNTDWTASGTNLWVLKASEHCGF